MRVRTAFAVAILAFCSAFQSTTFDGCGGGRGPGRPLPPSDEPTCVTDDDCPSMACEGRACVAGTCMVVSALRDFDGDGSAPPPCGDDCDDGDGTIGPDEDELCDGFDQDCDGAIDEGAPPVATRTTLAISDEVVRAAAFGDGMLLVEGGTDVISIGFDGRTGTPASIEDVEPPTLYDVTTSADGAAVVVFHTSTGLLEGIPVALGAGLDPIPGTRFLIADLSLAAAPLDLAAHTVELAAGPTLVVTWWDTFGASWIWSEGFAAPIEIEASAMVPAAPDVATDGTSIVTTRGASTAVFFDGTGVEVGTNTMPGAWARRPLEPSGTRVLALIHDAFDHAALTFSATDESTPRPVPSVFPAGLPARFDAGSEFDVLTRYDDGITAPTSGTSGVFLWLLDPTSLENLASFSRADVSGAAGLRVTDYDVVVSAGGIAVISSLGFSGMTLATFECRSF